MTTRIVAAASPGEVRVAVLRGDDLLDYAIWRPGAPDGVGDLHRGRITARAPGLGGAFVALADADGFLPDTEGGKTATEGTILDVRVIRAAQGGKGPRLSARLTVQEQSIANGRAAGLAANRATEILSGGAQRSSDGPQRSRDGAQQSNDGAQQRSGGAQLSRGRAQLSPGGAQQSHDEAQQRSDGAQQRSDGVQQRRDGDHRSRGGAQRSAGGTALSLLRRGPGAVERLAAIHPDAPVWVDDPVLAAALRPILGSRLAIRSPLLHDDLRGQIDALAQPEYVLPNGSRLSFHPTPALVAIDVDTGGATGGHLAVNRALLPVLTRQIRLRNLSGAILVDLAGLQAGRRSALGPALAEALADDPVRPRLLGFTALGLAEIVRPRVHPPLHELLAGPHAAGLAALREIAGAVSADPGRMPALRAAPAVVSALQCDQAALADLARRTGRSLILRSDPSLTANAWSLEAP